MEVEEPGRAVLRGGQGGQEAPDTAKHWFWPPAAAVPVPYARGGYELRVAGGPCPLGLELKLKEQLKMLRCCGMAQHIQITVPFSSVAAIKLVK